MQFISGVLVTALFFVAMYGAYRLGRKSKRPTVQADEEERKKAVKMRQGFEQLMSYDVTTALKGKKVSE
jgi:hypothetical protein